MGHTHQEQLELAQQIEEARTKAPIGALYTHYKSAEKIYRIISLGFLEATDELCVVYRAEYGEHLTYIRPLTVWLEQVEWEGKTVPRFTKL